MRLLVVVIVVCRIVEGGFKGVCKLLMVVVVVKDCIGLVVDCK